MIDIYMRIAFASHRTAFLLIHVKFRYASHDSHTLRYTMTHIQINVVVQTIDSRIC